MFPSADPPPPNTTTDRVGGEGGGAGCLGVGTQTKSMVNYSLHLAAIHYTAFIIHHMANDMPCKPEQPLSPAGVGEASCHTSHKTNALALT